MATTEEPPEKPPERRSTERLILPGHPTDADLAEACRLLNEQRRQARVALFTGPSGIRIHHVEDTGVDASRRRRRRRLDG